MAYAHLSDQEVLAEANLAADLARTASSKDACLDAYCLLEGLLIELSLREQRQETA